MKTMLRKIRAWAIRPVTNELENLQTEIEHLRKQTADVQSRVSSTQSVVNDLISYQAKPTLLEVEAMLSKKQLGFAETLKRIKSENLSFSRFGDGEFKLMLRPTYNLRFQPFSAELADDLRGVFMSNATDHKLLLGFPTLYTDLHWSRVWMDIWPELKAMDTPNKIWGNSHVSRPICFQTLGKEGVSLWRDIWEDRDVIVITGKNSRMELIPELFDNIRSLHTIEGEPINAYAHLDELHSNIKPTLNSGALYLIALGPTGTVLSSQLAAMGEQAIDIGHISDSYETVFRGGAWPESKPVLKKK